jgi:methionyl aminopeptidase
MSLEILSAREQARMRRAGRVAAEVLAAIGERIRPGVSTLEIDQWARAEIVARGARSSQLGYCGFPAAVCTSRNEVVCHGIPSPGELLRDGDIVNVDVTVEVDGYHGDTSDTFTVGSTSHPARDLIAAVHAARDAAIREIRPGARLGDLGAVIEALAASRGYSVVREYGGHGIGRAMHQPPHIAHGGPAGRGARLRAGMAITIEPMLNLGRPEVWVQGDGWRVVTRDGSWSAQAEHTILVTEDGAEVLTRL